MKVRVLKSKDRFYWYARKIGKVYEVVREDENNYYTNGEEEVRMIDNYNNYVGWAIGKEDSEVVEDVEKSCDTCKFYEKDRDLKYLTHCTLGKFIECLENNSLKYWQPIELTEDKFRRLEFEKEFPPCELVTNSNGGKQSKIETAFSLVPHDSLLAVAKVMKIGSERYEKDNWRKLSTDEIYDHLMEHLICWHITGNMEDLEHAITRAMMLYSVANHGH